MTRRWVQGKELSASEWSQIDEILATQGWSSLNADTCMLELIEDEQGIVGFIVLQLHPFVGPAYVRPSSRGSNLQASMADDMVAKLKELEARGWLVVADCTHTAKLCEQVGMTRVTEPVYRTQ